MSTSKRGKVKMRCCWSQGVGGQQVVWTSNLYFFMKENWICTMIRYHANILLARNIPLDSDLRQRSHSLMIPLHCLWDKSNHRTCGQFEYVQLYLCIFVFCFCLILFITCTGWMLFHSLFTFSNYVIKQVYCKMSTKKFLF